MATPTNGTVSATSIIINWTALIGTTNTGNDPILNYIVQYNSGTGAGWVNATTASKFSTSFTHSLGGSTPFPANTDRTDYFVQYRLVAVNNLGMGIPSSPLSVQTCTYPNQPAAVTVTGTITPVYIVFGWTLLTTNDYDTGRSPVTHYSLIW